MLQRTVYVGDMMETIHENTRSMSCFVYSNTSPWTISTASLPVSFCLSTLSMASEVSSNTTALSFGNNCNPTSPVPALFRALSIVFLTLFPRTSAHLQNSCHFYFRRLIPIVKRDDAKLSVILFVLIHSNDIRSIVQLPVHILAVFNRFSFSFTLNSSFFILHFYSSLLAACFPLPKMFFFFFFLYFHLKSSIFV